jgi:tetratricopeptide (TPR) repeat protein
VVDGAAVPKVIDFGVAKATGGSLTERTLFTSFAQLIGTPLYMSPEQADLSGVDVDTRSDIYALGVLLYELLTGTTPFDQEALRKAAFDEVRRIIREEEPPKPSTRISSLSETLRTVSANRKADPRHLGRSMRGELDWIVMRALEKDRKRRYETASDFASDVMRYLTDKPVEACPPSAWYRFTKYARRNRKGLITAGLVATALLIGTFVSAWEAVRATKAERLATAALEDSRLVVDYLVEDVFGAAAPEKTRGRTLTIHDLLAAGETVIPARFGRRPLVEAAAREALGRAYYDLGRYDEAAAQFRRVAALRAKPLGPDHPDTLAAEALIVRSLCPPGVVLPCRPNEAEPIASRVLEARRRTFGPEHPQTLASMTALAHVLWVKLRQAYIKNAEHDPMQRLPDHVIRARGSTSMEEARILLERAYNGQSRKLVPQHPETLETLDTLGRVLGEKPDYTGAEVALRRAVEGRRLVLGPVHPETLQSLKYLGDILATLGRRGEATQLYRESLEGHRQTFGLTHLQTSSPLGRLMDSYRTAGDTIAIRDLCESWLRDILASPIDSDPYQRDRRWITLGKLALALFALPAPVPFDAELAARAAKEAAAVNGGWYGWTMLGAIHCRTGRLDEALQAFQAATQQPNWAGGNDLYWFALAVAHARRGDLARAGECYERSRAPDTRRDSFTDITDVFRTEAAALLGVPDPPKTKE